MVLAFQSKFNVLFAILIKILALIFHLYKIFTHHYLPSNFWAERERPPRDAKLWFKLEPAYGQHPMDKITIKTANPKCRLNWSLIEFIDRRYSVSCWYFRPSFVNCCPPNLLSGSRSPPPLFPLWISKCTVYRGGGGGYQTDKHLAQSSFTGKFF